MGNVSKLVSIKRCEGDRNLFRIKRCDQGSDRKVDVGALKTEQILNIHTSGIDGGNDHR